MSEQSTGVMDRPVFRLPIRFSLSWLAILLGDLMVWSLEAITKSEPTQTFTFNFIQSNLGFLATLSLGGALLITIGSEIVRSTTDTDQLRSSSLTEAGRNE